MTFPVSWDHVHLRSADPDAAAAFYVEMLGAEARGRVEAGAELRVTVALGGVPLFIDRAAPGAAPAPEAPMHGIDHLALTVPDLDAALGALRDKGVEIVSGPTDVRPGLRIAFLRAPDRVRIELLERGAQP